MSTILTLRTILRSTLRVQLLFEGSISLNCTSVFVQSQLLLEARFNFTLLLLGIFPLMQVVSPTYYHHHISFDFLLSLPYLTSNCQKLSLNIFSWSICLGPTYLVHHNLGGQEVSIFWLSGQPLSFHRVLECQEQRLFSNVDSFWLG